MKIFLAMPSTFYYNASDDFIGDMTTLMPIKI